PSGQRRWPPKYLRSRERHENRGVEIVGSEKGNGIAVLGLRCVWALVSSGLCVVRLRWGFPGLAFARWCAQHRDLGREAPYVRHTVSCAAGRAGFSLVAHGHSGRTPDLQQQGPDPAPIPPSPRSGNFYFAARRTEGDGWVSTHVRHHALLCLPKSRAQRGDHRCADGGTLHIGDHTAHFSLYARRQQAVSGVCGLGPFIGEAGTGGFSLLLEAEKARLETCRELLRNVIDRGAC